MVQNIFQRVAVHGLIINNEGKILVAHRCLNNDHKPDETDIFGGSVEMGEVDLEKALAREIMEEANLEVEIIRVLDVYSHMSNLERHQFQITYLCKYNGGDIKYEVDDHDAHSWVTKDELTKIPKKIAFLEQLSRKISEGKIIL